MDKTTKGRITRISNRLSAARKAFYAMPVPTFAEIWAGVADILPENGKIESEEAGDWQPWYCDDCETWHQTAYSLDFDANGEVMEGKSGPCIEANSVDQDGNWEFDSASFDGDKNWPSFYREYVSSFSYFAKWAEYHLWSAENDCSDPLGNWFSAEKNTVENNLKSALENVRCLESMVKRGAA